MLDRVGIGQAGCQMCVVKCQALLASFRSVGVATGVPLHTTLLVGDGGVGELDNAL